MSKIATISLGFTVTGDSIIATQVSVPAFGSQASPYEHQPVALVNGANTLTPPTGTLFVILIPPTNSAITKTLKGVSGDTGIPLVTNLPSFLSLVASPGTFVITANGAETLDVYWL